MSKSISIPARTEKVKGKGKKQTSQVVQAMIEAFYRFNPRALFGSPILFTLWLAAVMATVESLLGQPLSELKKKLANEDKTFVWVKRQVDEPLALKVKALGVKGIYLRKDYKRQYPEGEAAAHVVGFTNVEDLGQEGVELTFDKALAGKPGDSLVATLLDGRPGSAMPPWRR